jgi:YqaJ-like viral recombinase domain
MKFIVCDQGTLQWLEERCGSITTSRFFDAVSTVGGLNLQQKIYVDAVCCGMTVKEAMKLADYKTEPKSEIIRLGLAGKKTERYSDIAEKYAADIAIERISGKPYGEPVKAWVLDRGHELEVQARLLYETRTGLVAMESGIVKTDDDWFGYSTDGMVGDDGLIEIKCPIDSLKIMTMLRTGDVSEYMHQMQGGMWITGAKWCDFIMYVPDLGNCGKDLYIKRVTRDDDFIETMESGLLAFRSRVQEIETLLLK